MTRAKTAGRFVGKNLLPILLLTLASIYLLLLIVPAILARTIPSPVYYTNAPFPVTGVVHAGKPMTLTVGRCNVSGAPMSYSFTRNLVSDDTQAIIVLPSGEAEINPGCHTVLSVVNVVPVDTIPGRWHMEAISTVKGKWATYTLPWQTQSFTVVP